MILVDVWALQKNNGLLYGSGNYRTLIQVPNGNPLNAADVVGYTWIKLANAISQDEAYYIMNQYDSSTRSKCEDCDEDSE